MATRTAPRQHRSPALGSDSGYARVWTTAAVITAGVWMVVGLLQTPRVPLFCLAAALSVVGGTLFVRAPARTARGRREYVVGMATVAGLVVVAVGMGHHITAGLTTLALLIGSSPIVPRWLAGE